MKHTTTHFVSGTLTALLMVLLSASFPAHAAGNIVVAETFGPKAGWALETDDAFVLSKPDLMSGNFDMFVLSRNHLSNVADPIGFLTADYTCDGGYNLTKWYIGIKITK